MELQNKPLVDHEEFNPLRREASHALAALQQLCEHEAA